MNAAPAGPYRQPAPFPSSSSLHARGLTGLLVRASLAVATWGERRALRQADAAVARPASVSGRAVQGWDEPVSEHERYAARRSAGFLAP